MKDKAKKEVPTPEETPTADPSIAEEVDLALDHILNGGELLSDMAEEFPSELLLPEDSHNESLDRSCRGEIFGLFEELLWANMQPFKDCMFGILANKSPQRYFPLLEGLLHPLLYATGPGTLDYRELHHILIGFQSILEEMRCYRGRLPRTILKQIQRHYQDFIEIVDAKSVNMVIQDMVVAESKDTANLLEELRKIPMVGPKRIERLVKAGLADAEVLRDARPRDIAASTGIPVNVAARIRKVARDYLVREKRTKLLRLLGMATEMQEIIDSLDPALKLTTMDNAFGPVRLLEQELRGSLDTLLEGIRAD